MEKRKNILQMYELKKLKRVLPGMRVKALEFCNKEDIYFPGDMGTISYVDDMYQAHIKWDNKGSIAIIKEDKFDVWTETIDTDNYFLGQFNTLESAKEYTTHVIDKVATQIIYENELYNVYVKR